MGHGIGRRIHDAPEVPNTFQPELTESLCEGLVITIEPIVAAGSPQVRMARDGWTVRTADSSWCAHASTRSSSATAARSCSPPERRRASQQLLGRPRTAAHDLGLHPAARPALLAQRQEGQRKLVLGGKLRYSVIFATSAWP